MYDRATIFCDIDGTLVKHYPSTITSNENHKMELLPGVHQKLLEWEKLGYVIILTTARKESLRKVTEKQLSDVGIFYDQLIMGLSSGKRYVINDNKTDGRNTAYAINIDRNDGISNINI